MWVGGGGGGIRACVCVRTYCVCLCVCARVGACIYQFDISVPNDIVQELCEGRGGRPGLSVLTNLLVSVDVNLY